MHYIWHHIHSLWCHTTLWHHTHCIHVTTPNISDIRSIVAASLLTMYWFYHTYSMCDIKCIICMTSYECFMTSHPVFMTSHDCIHDTHPLYSWHHTHCILDHIHSTCDIKATVYMTQHLLCSWHHTHYIRHLTWCMNDNTTTVSDITLTVSV